MTSEEERKEGQSWMDKIADMVRKAGSVSGPWVPFEVLPKEEQDKYRACVRGVAQALVDRATELPKMPGNEGLAAVSVEAGRRRVKIKSGSEGAGRPGVLFSALEVGQTWGVVKFDDKSVPECFPMASLEVADDIPGGLLLYGPWFKCAGCENETAANDGPVFCGACVQTIREDDKNRIVRTERLRAVRTVKEARKKNDFRNIDLELLGKHKR